MLSRPRFPMNAMSFHENPTQMRPQGKRAPSFPGTLGNGTAMNGGLPQSPDFSLQKHLASLSTIIEEDIPSVGFRGVAVLDFEDDEVYNREESVDSEHRHWFVVHPSSTFCLIWDLNGLAFIASCKQHAMMTCEETSQPQGTNSCISTEI